MALGLGFQLSRNSLSLIGSEAGEAGQCGKILGSAAVQQVEDKDSSITLPQRRVMQYMHGNSCTPCMMKYWLAGLEMPNVALPCEHPPTLPVPRKTSSDRQNKRKRPPRNGKS